MIKFLSNEKKTFKEVGYNPETHRALTNGENVMKRDFPSTDTFVTI
jgi:hypothetical protein